MRFAVCPSATAMFRASVVITVGAGESILFWEDPWIGGLSVAVVAPAVLRLVKPGVVSRRKVSEGMANNSWVRDISGTLSVDAVVQFLKLWVAVESAPRGAGADVLAWKWTADGKFSSKSAYRAFFHGTTALPGATLVWHSFAPFKYRFHAWLWLRRRSPAGSRKKRANTCSVIATLWEENGDTVLPSSLSLLELRRCYLQPSSFFKLLNNLSSLHTLTLQDCDTVEMPSLPLSLHHLRMLKRLKIHKCDWISSIEGSEALLCLEEMSIYQCYDFESVPSLDDMPCLQKLHLFRCPQVMRLSKAGHPTALKELVVCCCDGLSSLEKLCDLVSLVRLSVTDCSDLLSLPDMDGFYSLRDLRIARCPQLMSLPRSGLPVSLETFSVSGCHQALEEQFQRQEGSDWNKFAALPGCKWEIWSW
ncbi:hypothetical protein ACQ4PT_031574 [Festuca glaucescens]